MAGNKPTCAAPNPMLRSSFLESRIENSETALQQQKKMWDRKPKKNTPKNMARSCMRTRYIGECHANLDPGIPVRTKMMAVTMAMVPLMKGTAHTATITPARLYRSANTV